MSFATSKTKTLLLLSAILICAFHTENVKAQSGASTINGSVVDQQGASVAGATVRLTNPDTGFTRTVTTGGEGNYTFSALLPGTYRLEVEAANFKKAVNNEVKALVDSTVAVNIALEAGDVSAIVDITSGQIESVVNTQDATIGNNFVSRQITQLPTESRNVPDLLSLQPGVTRDGSVTGSRSDQANVTLDGIDINDQQTGAAFNSVLRITSEAVDEFRVTTTNPNANQGRSSGAQVSLITKSGTNDFRGAAFLFHRPSRFSANNFFNNRAGRYTANDFAVQSGLAQAGEEKVPRPDLQRNIFGGAVGGPIVKDKAFFFYSYEGLRERQSVSVVTLVPTASLGRGELRFFGAAPGDPAGTNRLVTLNTAQLNSIYPQAGINPAAIAILADAARRYPVNDDTVGDGLNTGGFRFNAPAPVDQNTHILRFDWNINNKQSLSFRSNYQQDTAPSIVVAGTNIPQYLPDAPAPKFWSHPYGFGLSHNWTLSGDKINNFRYGLTRQAFTAEGDANENAVVFRFVFQPKGFTNTLSRITATHNFTDDFTWVKGNHTIQFGGNIRLINNRRQTYVPSYDFAVVNPSYYASSGRVLDNAVTGAGYSIGSGQRSVVQNAAASLIGRFSQYTATYNYDLEGNLLLPGTPIERRFATEEYDTYVQDIWKPFRNLTLTFGLRYGLSRPVYEKDGYQVVPDQRLGDFFEKRKESSAQGIPYNELIQFELGGPRHGKPGFYSMDWNNVQPRAAFAWSPNFKNRFLRTVFGSDTQSVIRGGFAMTNDYFGQQLAVSFDALTTLGFTTSDTIGPNTYNLTSNLAPRFTGFGQSIRTLPNVQPLANRFLTPADEDQRIESSLDATLVAPTHYSWNLTFGRQLPKGMYFEASYIGRKARNLLVSRDIMALNNLVDPKSGMDWYTAAGMLADFRDRNTPLNQIPMIPYFENIFPGLGNSFWGDPTLSATQSVYQIVAREDYLGADFYNNLDWTFVQLLLDDESVPLGRNIFFHPQYATFAAFSTIGKSDYHGGVFTLRQRLGQTLTYDVNYTFSKSIDNASGLQTSTSFGAAFLLNPLRPEDNRSVSDFDARHIVNANFIFQLPFGKGRQFFNNLNTVADALLGGWQLTGIYRWNTGLPISSPFDAAQWATNWNAQSFGVRARPVKISVDRRNVNIFSDPAAAYQSFRNARAGETGERNIFREPAYWNLDLGLAKSFTMPWSENHQLQLRWEVFNVANTQHFAVTAADITRGTFGLDIDPQLGEASPEFGKVFTSIQGQPRRMQFGLRYSF